MPGSLKGHEVAFHDSLTLMGMKPKKLEEIQEQYSQISFIYILQTNKKGVFMVRRNGNICAM